MLKKAFVTTSVYALAHQIGMREAIAEVARQLDQPGKDSLPVVRTIHRLRHMVEVKLHVDGGATYIGMARSRAFHEAWESQYPCWLSLDDDIEVTQDTCSAMLDALDDVLPRILITPYVERSGDEDPRMVITMPVVRQERVLTNRGRAIKLAPGQGGGFGFVGMNRRAMEEIVAHVSTKADPRDHLDRSKLRWLDSDGREKLALFYEALEDGLWYGEDTSFFKFRVPPSVTVEALCCGTSLHSGFALPLSTL